MNKIFKKIGSRSASLFIALTLITNNILAVEPKINESALIDKFRTDYSEKTSSVESSTGFCRNPSDKFTHHDVPSLCYKQEGGTYDGEIRDVYVWNLPGVVDVESFGICALLLYCLNNASKNLDEGAAISLIEYGNKLIKAGAGAGVTVAAVKLSGNIDDILQKAAIPLNTKKETLITVFQKSMEFFGVSPNDMAKIINNCLNKFKGLSSSKFAPWAFSFLSGVIALLGVACTLGGCAKINENARNIADAETIIDTFLMLIDKRKYLGSNIVVMAKDNTSIPFYDPCRKGVMPFIGFWRHKGLAESKCAPIFEESFYRSEPSTPRWALTFISDLEGTVPRLTDSSAPASVKKALEDAKKSLADAKAKAKAKAAIAALPLMGKAIAALPSTDGSSKALPDVSQKSIAEDEDPSHFAIVKLSSDSAQSLTE